ncbi:hypothetical protein LCGC14_3142990, partial [marine sediment metagenome]
STPATDSDRTNRSVPASALSSAVNDAGLARLPRLRPEPSATAN